MDAIKGLIIGVVYVFLLFQTPYVHAELIQLSPQECESFANSGGTIAKWRSDGMIIEEAMKFYEEQVGEPKSALSDRNKLIYQVIKEQIKYIYGLSQEDFSKLTPYIVAEKFYNSCTKAKGKINIPLGIEI